MRNYEARPLTPFQQRIRAYEQTDTWRFRAARYRATGRDTCQGCGITRPGLDVHHVTYARAFNGAEPDRDLRLFCRRCHDEIHALTRTSHPVGLAQATNIVARRSPAGRRRHRRAAAARFSLAAIAALALLLWVTQGGPPLLGAAVILALVAAVLPS